MYRSTGSRPRSASGGAAAMAARPRTRSAARDRARSSSGAQGLQRAIATREALVDLAPRDVLEERIDVLRVGRTVVHRVRVLEHVEHEQRLAERDRLAVARRAV